MKIAIGNDHSAVELKNIIVDFLKEKGIPAKYLYSFPIHLYLSHPGLYRKFKRYR